MGGEQSVAVGLAHERGGLRTKHVVHDAGALVKVVQPGQQGAYAGLQSHDPELSR